MRLRFRTEKPNSVRPYERIEKEHLVSKRDRPPIGGLSHKSRVDNLPVCRPIQKIEFKYVHVKIKNQHLVLFFFNFYTGAACLTDGNSINWITADGLQQVNLNFFFKLGPSIR